MYLLVFLTALIFPPLNSSLTKQFIIPYSLFNSDFYFPDMSPHTMSSVYLFTFPGVSVSCVKAATAAAGVAKKKGKERR